jgi:hypothetical protein
MAYLCWFLPFETYIAALHAPTLPQSTCTIDEIKRNGAFFVRRRIPNVGEGCTDSPDSCNLFQASGFFNDAEP